MTTDHPAAQPTDYLLIKGQADASLAQAFEPRLRAMLERDGISSSLHRVAHAREPGLLYAYVRLAQRQMLGAADVAAFTTRIGALDAALNGIRVSRLQLVQDLPGHSRDATPRTHYVVETDVEDGWMPEIVRWYEQEHMPGLSKVPGCVWARRMINHDHAPISLACYDLLSPEVLESPPWLAVRGTDWSSRARPHFNNTLRTVFAVVGGA